MKVDLEKKSLELKTFVSQYDTKMFLGHITSLIQFIRSNNPIPSLRGLTSPQRQLYYLSALNVTSDLTNVSKAYPSDEEFETIKSLLTEIESGYLQFFEPSPDTELDEDWVRRRAVAMPTFLGYFNQGQLNYEEQVIERVIDYFSPFNDKILVYFGISIEDFIEIYNFIDAIPNTVLATMNKKENDQSWEEFAEEMFEKGIMPPDWQEHLPERFKNLFGYLSDQGKTHRFSKQELVDKFGSKAEAFLGIFTCQRISTDFLYYTEKNILHTKPIFEIELDTFQAIETKQILHAIYNCLFDFCTKDDKIRDKFYKRRGQMLENKIVQVFQDFFDGKATIYSPYYTQEKHEQDILILIDGLALIIEAKASKRDEPKRSPDMAYPEILSNFDETIQYGYDQAYRVKSKFINKKTLELYRDQKLQKHITNLRTKGYHHAFSIIVTLERFGQIQTDLYALLEIWDDDEFPWSICIDDLEVFLLQLKKSGKKKADLIHFLNLRQKLHGKLITGDELEVCGAFINGKLTHKIATTNQTLIPAPDFADVFDRTYHSQGLGFKNEKYLEMKTSGKYLRIGG